MKTLLRSSIAQSTLAVLFAAWLRLCWATMRWTRVDRAAVEGVWDAGGPVVVCFWHSRIGIAPPAWSRRGQPLRGLISLSRDGEFIARAMALIGIPAIRGSSAKASAKDKAKGGGAAFRDGLRWLKSGGAVALTPDGPRGPVEEMAEGAPLFAATTGAPVLFLGLAASPAIRLGGWDQGVLPLPFARGVIVWDGPVRVPREADVAALRLEWAARLSAATRRAEAIAAGAPA